MVRITDRDARLIQTIGAFGMLATRQVGELLFPGIAKTTLCRRLRALEGQGLLHRLRGLPDASLMWALTPKCADDLGLEGRIRRINRNSLEHDLLLGDVRIALTKAGIVDNWTAEHELRHQASKAKYERRIEVELIPDALVTVNVKGTFRVVALELEQRMKSQKRYKKIFQNYLSKSTIWALWYVVPDAWMGQQLERLWLKEPRYIRAATFMWSTIPDVLQNLSEAQIHQSGKQYPLTGVLTA